MTKNENVHGDDICPCSMITMSILFLFTYLWVSVKHGVTMELSFSENNFQKSYKIRYFFQPYFFNFWSFIIDFRGSFFWGGPPKIFGVLGNPNTPKILAFYCIFKKQFSKFLLKNIMVSFIITTWRHDIVRKVSDLHSHPEFLNRWLIENIYRILIIDFLHWLISAMTQNWFGQLNHR